MTTEGFNISRPGEDVKVPCKRGTCVIITSYTTTTHWEISVSSGEDCVNNVQHFSSSRFRATFDRSTE